MRFKVSGAEAVHLWAHQTQSHAEGGNIFFIERSLYSYGRHFEIARHVTGTKSRRAILMNTASYSPSTSKHQSYARQAVNHMTSFYLPINFIPSNVSNATLVDFAHKYAKDEIRKAITLASTARKRKEEHLSSARQDADQFNRLAEFFGSKKRIILPPDFETMLADAKAEAERIAKRDRIKNAKAEKARQEARNGAIAEAIESVPAWQRGEIQSIRNAYSLTDVYLRFIEGGETIQTSMGVRFPAEHGKRAYRILKRLKDRGQDYHRNGHTIHCGHYAIDSSNGETIMAGCHKLSWMVLEAFASNAGWSLSDGIEDATDNGDNGRDGYSATDSRQDERAGSDTIAIGGSDERQGR
jgi:hypothetical protein